LARSACDEALLSRSILVHPTCGDRLTNYNVVQGLREQDSAKRSAGKSCCGTGVPVFGGPSPGERQGGAKRNPQLVDLPSPSWRMQDGYCQGFLN